MIDILAARPEARYGIPTADQLLFNREYIVGYSYLFRQAKWAIELINSESQISGKVKRSGGFRADLRIADQFRANTCEYKRSGYDRGHLISSGDRSGDAMHNSETFLLSNMSPQAPLFNQGIWNILELSVRNLVKIYPELYVICGPIFDFNKKIDVIGQSDDDNMTVPIPHAYFKSVLAEDQKGVLKLWSFILPNEASNKHLSNFLVSTAEIEIRAGLQLWSLLNGESFYRLKSKVNKKMFDQYKSDNNENKAT